MLRKKTNTVTRSKAKPGLAQRIGETRVDRRSFLRTSGLAVGGLAAVGAMGGTLTIVSGSSGLCVNATAAAGL